MTDGTRIRAYTPSEYLTMNYPDNIELAIMDEFNFVWFDCNDEHKKIIKENAVRLLESKQDNYIYEFFCGKCPIYTLEKINRQSSSKVHNAIFRDLAGFMKTIVKENFNSFIDYDTPYITYLKLIDSEQKKTQSTVITAFTKELRSIGVHSISIGDLISSINYYSNGNMLKDDYSYKTGEWMYSTYRELIKSPCPLMGIEGLAVKSLIFIMWSIDIFYGNVQDTKLPEKYRDPKWKSATNIIYNKLPSRYNISRHKLYDYLITI